MYDGVYSPADTPPFPALSLHLSFFTLGAKIPYFYASSVRGRAAGCGLLAMCDPCPWMSKGLSAFIDSSCLSSFGDGVRSHRPIVIFSMGHFRFNWMYKLLPIFYLAFPTCILF